MMGGGEKFRVLCASIQTYRRFDVLLFDLCLRPNIVCQYTDASLCSSVTCDYDDTLCVSIQTFR